MTYVEPGNAIRRLSQDTARLRSIDPRLAYSQRIGLDEFRSDVACLTCGADAWKPHADTCPRWKAANPHTAEVL